ncbi:MAG TPA: rhodanese-like domain-containing protein, partial [Usitatibacter sp.]|nr:rhodanese-like domain-containing protein [Usitatibacter sp.]
MNRTVDARTLKSCLHDGAEIALLDVREQGQYGESHLFFAVPFPFSRLEVAAPRMLPRLSTRLVVYDDGELSVAQRAARRFEELGYANVHVLEGGTRGWAAAGFALFAGVNVPSKTFGELVEHACHTPRVSAAQLLEMRRAGRDVAVIDGRPLSEFRKMSIPGARCCPNGELAYRIRAMVPDANTTIVVNCAGRTRSIVGAQTLIDLGIPNPVYALENGTQGWYLADHELEHGATRGYPEIARDEDLSAARAHARSLAERHGVRWIDDPQACEWLADEARTTYLLDVRTAEEFAAGSVTGAVHAAGGQLIQATDQWVAVRNARLLLVDADEVRAPVVASWLRRMGHDAHVLRAGIASTARVEIASARLPDVRSMPAAALRRALDSRDVEAIDLRSSMAYRKAHVPGSMWSIRPRLEDLLPRVGDRRVVLVADDSGIARIAAFDLARAGVRQVAMLEGGFAAWQAAGGAIESTPDSPSDAQCIDYLFFVHDRHDGNKDAARRYLAWETQLLAQLDERDLGSYRIGPGVAAARK